MKLALHRSITFWSGLLVMAFVCWAWWDSMQSRTVAYASRCGLESYAGGCFLIPKAAPDLVRGGPLFGQLHIPVADEHEAQIMPPVRLLRGLGGSVWELPNPPKEKVSYLDTRAFILNLQPESYLELFVPYWLILLTLAAVWLALLFWRARRRKRIITP